MRAQSERSRARGGHHHLNVTSVAAHRRFWVDTLGATPIRIGTAPAEVFRLPNLLVFTNERAPSGGTKGTTVNHVGFQVPDLRRMVDNVKAAGYPVVTRAELPAQIDVKDDLAVIAHLNTSVAFVMAPDDTKVEFVENTAMTEPIALHHIHFAAAHVPEMRDWYVRTLGARPGQRGSFEVADLPGVNLTFSQAPAPVVGTRGRAIDHIGFEVNDLEAFCGQLEANGVHLNLAYTRVAAQEMATASITDPWGTDIELTEGLETVA